MTITTLPAAPSRSDAPAVFIAKADAFVAALAVLVTEMNAAVGIVNMTEWISGTAYAIGDVTWSPADFQAYRRKTAGAGATDPSADAANWQRTEYSASSAQTQSATAFTTAGAAPAFTLTPAPAIAGYAAGQRFRVKFNAAGTTGSNTLNVCGQGAKNLKQFDSTGAKVAGIVAANQLADVEYDGVDMVMLTPLPVGGSRLQPISASVGSNALTISAGALSLDFRSETLGSGTVATVSGTPANLVISSGSTLGTINAVPSRIAVLAMNNAGTIELAAVNLAGGNDLSETGVISTTAEGGAGAADSASVVYSATARANLAYRVIGYIESTQATAGIWATAPSTIQGAGGQAFEGMSGLGYGQTWQNVSGSRTSGTTYYNTTGKPIMVMVQMTTGTVTIVVGGVTLVAADAGSIPKTFIVPPGNSYVVTNAGGYLQWNELR